VLLLAAAEVNDLRHRADENQEKMLVSSFCRPLTYTPDTAGANTVHYNPPITLFQLSVNAGNMMVGLREHRYSVLFRNMWTQQCR
jgi:hypothetical protein